MSEGRHTRGPLGVEYADHGRHPGWFVVDAADHAICWVHERGDALRFAAAPDLLEALEGAIGALEQDYETGKDYGDADWEGLAFQRLQAARAAIAKAKGEA